MAGKFQTMNLDRNFYNRFLLKSVQNFEFIKSFICNFDLLSFSWNTASIQYTLLYWCSQFTRRRLYIFSDLPRHTKRKHIVWKQHTGLSTHTPIKRREGGFSLGRFWWPHKRCHVLRHSFHNTVCKSLVTWKFGMMSTFTDMTHVMQAHIRNACGTTFQTETRSTGNLHWCEYPGWAVKAGEQFC